MNFKAGIERIYEYPENGHVDSSCRIFAPW